jgi:hypothetical protein
MITVRGHAWGVPQRLPQLLQQCAAVAVSAHRNSCCASGAQVRGITLKNLASIKTCSSTAKNQLVDAGFVGLFCCWMAQLPRPQQLMTDCGSPVAAAAMTKPLLCCHGPTKACPRCIRLLSTGSCARAEHQTVQQAKHVLSITPSEQLHHITTCCIR